jgi:hypothetical protein
MSGQLSLHLKGQPGPAPAFTTVREDGIAVVTFDLPDESVNTFSSAVKDEFTRLME